MGADQTVAECMHAGEIGGKPHEETKELFVEFLTSGRVIELVEPDVFVAEAARDLRWNHGINLKGADAIHFATAISMSCSEFLTTDKLLKKSGSKFPTAVPQFAALGLMVRRPSETMLLPDNYRQYELEG
jgi:hypothetical protein